MQLGHGGSLAQRPVPRVRNRGPGFKLFSWMVPGEMRLFRESELDQAKAWLAGQALAVSVPCSAATRGPRDDAHPHPARELR
jgi:hypothetical protein